MIYKIMAWLTAGGLIFVAVMLAWVWIESTIADKRLRKMHEQTEARRRNNGSHGGDWEYGHQGKVRRAARAAMLSDNLL